MERSRGKEGGGVRERGVDVVSFKSSQRVREGRGWS